MKTIGTRALFAVAALALMWTAGCDEEKKRNQATTVPDQTTWSSMTDAQRSDVRRVMNKFSGTGVQNIDVLEIIGIIQGEALRYAGALSDAYVVELPQLDLSDPRVLPENDINGNFDSTGGYLRFDETVHNARGAETSYVEVHQRAKQFDTGLIAIELSRVTDTPEDDWLVDGSGVELEIQDDISYTHTLWNQQVTRAQIDWGPWHGETYAYQSSPVRKVTSAMGGSLSARSVTDDRIYDSSGFETLTTETQTGNLLGTFTLYRPVAVTANNHGEQAFTVDTKTSGNITTTTTIVTTVDQYTELVGLERELEKTTETTSTMETTREEDSTSTCIPACVPLDETVQHTTVRRSYVVAEGKATEARRNRSLELFVDHVETTLTTTTETCSCQADGSWSQAEKTTELRFTNNPATRNNLNSWASTQMLRTTSYDDASNETTVVDRGTEWLTAQIEPDPDVASTAWKLAGTSDQTLSTLEMYFGDDKEGIETNVVLTRTLDVTYGWGADEVSVNGTITNRSASITPPSGETHEIAGDGDGTLEVKLNGESMTVSAEEWATIE